MAKKKPSPTIKQDLRKDLLKLDKLRAAKKKYEELIKNLNEKIQPMEKKCFDLMMGMDMQKLTMNKKTFYVTARQFFSMKDKAKATLWIKKYYPELLSVNAQQLTSFLNEMIEAGKKVPMNLFNKYAIERVGIRQNK